MSAAQDLQAVLNDLGIEVSRAGDREITGKCPVHVRTVGKVDRSPSWSINVSSGLWICFSCGARGTLSMLIHELTGDSSAQAQQFLVNAGMNRLVDKTDKKLVTEHVDVSGFYDFVRVSDVLCQDKNLDPDITWQHGVRWNKLHKCWALPIISTKGQLIGWQDKKSGWVRNRPTGVPKGETLFGLERFRAPIAVLVESPLDVVRFAAVIDSGTAQAVSSYGAVVSSEQKSIINSQFDQVIVAMDNDSAGRESSHILYRDLHPRKGVKWWNYTSTFAKDIGDMTDAEIVEGFTTATVVPPWISVGTNGRSKTKTVR